jgi:hypothetical protein
MNCARGTCMSYPDLTKRGIPYTRNHLRRLERQRRFPMHIIHCRPRSPI